MIATTVFLIIDTSDSYTLYHLRVVVVFVFLWYCDIFHRFITVPVRFLKATTMRFRPASSGEAMVSASKENHRCSIGSHRSSSSPLAKFPFHASDENGSSVTINNSTGAKKLSLHIAESVTPLPKRMKSIELLYPEHQDVPSRESIRAYYENAMKLENSHQSKISSFGLLSLEEVLLPAVVKEELQSIKKIQAKAQRDTPELVQEVMALRRAVCDAMRAGVDACRQARAQRETEQAERDRLWEQELLQVKEEERLQREEEKRIRREEKAKTKQTQREHLFRENKKKLPRNMELWREVAVLMTELSTMQKEEYAWKECQRRLTEQEQEIAIAEGNKPLESDTEDINVGPNVLKDRIHSAVQDILLCTRRIENAVKLTSNTIQQSEKTRKELYQKYKMDHQFSGYKGVNDPKALIRALSQSQDV